MIIRKIEEKDIQKLAKLMKSVYNEAPWNDEWTEESAEEAIKCLLAFPNFFGLIACDGDEALGAILGDIRPYSKQRTYYIDELFVSSAHRRQGIAKKLYEGARDELKNIGVSGAFFTTLKNSEAYKFYIKEGAFDLDDSAVFYHPFN